MYSDNYNFMIFTFNLIGAKMHVIFGIYNVISCLIMVVDISLVTIATFRLH